MSSRSRCPGLPGLGTVLFAVSCVGCFGPTHYWTDSIAWAPDGSRAVVVSDGLRLADVNGRITPALDADAYLAAWTADAQHIVFVRRREVRTFAAIAEAIGAERAYDLAQDAERLWWRLTGPGGIGDNDPIILRPDLRALSVYLRDNYRDELVRRFPSEVEAFDEENPNLHELVLARVAGDALEGLRTLHVGFSPVRSVRPSPDGRFIAFVTQGQGLFSDRTAETFVVQVGAPGRAVLAGSETSLAPDWTPDSLALLYLDLIGRFQTTGLTFGCLTRVEILDAAGILKESLGGTCEVIAGFEDESTIRSLPDGRVLFDAASVDVPGPLVIRPPASLFEYDPREGRDSIRVLVGPSGSRPHGIGFFEVAPGGERVLFGASADVGILTVADGWIEMLGLCQQEVDADRREHMARAVWSGRDGFTYLGESGGRPVLVLRRGSAETILSDHWPGPLGPGSDRQ